MILQIVKEFKCYKESLRVNSLVGTGENKIFAKDTININNTDNLAEILKANINIGNRDGKN